MLAERQVTIDVNLSNFYFVKLETYIRLMELGTVGTFSLADYVQFEQALNEATLDKLGGPCPDNLDLQFAYQVILAIRQMAREYIKPPRDLSQEYFPALFLYCLAVVKYYQATKPQPTRLIFATACALARYIC